MTIPIIKSDDNTLVVDSRLIAQELGIKHDNFMQTIEKHQIDIESNFGSILFETGTTSGKVNNPKPPKYCLLNRKERSVTHAFF
jgi:phage regulator Rha-like protein